MRELFLAATLLAPNAVTHEPVRVLVERYLGGQKDAAVAGLGALDQAETTAQAKQLMSSLLDQLIRDESRGAPLFKAGVMLFTDRALLERATGRIEPYWRNIDVAVFLVSEALSVLEG
jgi:hypothetical protein